MTLTAVLSQERTRGSEVRTGLDPDESVLAHTSVRQPDVDDYFVQRGERQLKQYGSGSVERVALMGIILASMPEVTFEDVAATLGVKMVRLEKFMHGESQIPTAYEAKWIQIAQILGDLHRIIKPQATGKWLHTRIDALHGLTPLETIKKGRISDVQALTRSYLDPSFS